MQTFLLAGSSGSPSRASVWRRNLHGSLELGFQLRSMRDRHRFETPRQEYDSIGTLIVRVGLNQVAIPGNSDQVIGVDSFVFATHPKDGNTLGPTQENRPRSALDAQSPDREGYFHTANHEAGGAQLPPVNRISTVTKKDRLAGRSSQGLLPASQEAQTGCENCKSHSR